MAFSIWLIPSFWLGLETDRDIFFSFKSSISILFKPGEFGVLHRRVFVCICRSLVCTKFPNHVLERLLNILPSEAAAELTGVRSHYISPAEIRCKTARADGEEFAPKEASFYSLLNSQFWFVRRIWIHFLEKQSRLTGVYQRTHSHTFPRGFVRSKNL